MNRLLNLFLAFSLFICLSAQAEAEKVINDEPTKKIDDSKSKSSHWEKRMKNMTPEQKAAFQKKIDALHSKLKVMTADERKAYMAKLKAERAARVAERKKTTKK